MSPLREALHDYLRVRRQLGFELKADGRLLEGFVNFLERAGAQHITTELALAWVKVPVDAHPHRWRQRLGDRARLRPVCGDDRPCQRGAGRGSAARRPAAGGAVYLFRGRDRGADGGREGAQPATARGVDRDADRADGQHWLAARRGARARPRPHDLRHAYAVRTLLGWHRSGEQVEYKLPLLATFLGHAHPASSYWYLQAVPELLELVGRRLDGALGEMP
jgi:hypothetical protein